MVSQPQRRRRILGVAIASNFSQFGARIVISPFVVAIAATFDSSTGQIGVVLTLLLASRSSRRWNHGCSPLLFLLCYVDPIPLSDNETRFRDRLNARIIRYLLF